MIGPVIAPRQRIGAVVADTVKAAAGAAPSGLLDLLPAAGRLAAWYAGDGSGGGSQIAAADGNPVSAWTEAVAALSLANTLTARPTYRKSVAGLNGRGAVEFNAAANQFLSVDLPAGILANRTLYTAYVVFATTSAAQGDMYGEFNSANGTPTVICRYIGSGVRALHRSTANVSANIQGGSGAGDGAAHLFTLKRTAANAFALYLDGVLIGTAATSPGTTGITRIEMGRFGGPSPSTYYTGMIAATVLYSVDNQAMAEPVFNSFYAM